YPVLVRSDGSDERGWLSGSEPNTTYRVEFFASVLTGQTQDYLGSLDVTTDSAGQAAFDVPFAVSADRPNLTATATDPSGNTSEVSQPRRPITLDVPRTRLHQRDAGPITLSAFSGTAIVVNDPEGDPSPLEELTISVDSGTLKLSGGNGLTGSGS